MVSAGAGINIANHDCLLILFYHTLNATYHSTLKNVYYQTNIKVNLWPQHEVFIYETNEFIRMRRLRAYDSTYDLFALPIL